MRLSAPPQIAHHPLLPLQPSLCLLLGPAMQQKLTQPRFSHRDRPRLILEAATTETHSTGWSVCMKKFLVVSLK